MKEVFSTSGYASRMGERSIQIDVSGEAGPLWVDVNAIEIEQVLVNLIRNAIEAKPVSRSVQIEVSNPGKFARIEVRDDGCGISDADRERVFDPFFTTRIHEGGSGLGLSLAMGIVREHEGTMSLDSDLGKGTLVRVEVPLATIQ